MSLPTTAACSKEDAMPIKSHLVFLFTALVLLAAPAAFAIELADAKSQGLVGEQSNGYLGVVKNAPGVQALVDSVNAKRRDAYQKIAAK